MLSWISKLLAAIPVLGTVLTDLFPSLAQNKTIQQVINVADLSATDIANYDSGQAVVVATLNPSEVPGATQNGVLVAMQDGGPAYQALFGSNT